MHENRGFMQVSKQVFSNLQNVFFLHCCTVITSLNVTVLTKSGKETKI